MSLIRGTNLKTDGLAGIGGPRRRTRGHRHLWLRLVPWSRGSARVCLLCGALKTGEGSITLGSDLDMGGGAIISRAAREGFENHLFNSSFEVGDPPYGWESSGGGGHARSTTQVKLGTYSLRVLGSFDTQTIYGAQRYRGRKVSVGVWAWHDVANYAFLRLQNNGDWAYNDSPRHTGDSTWQWLTATHLVPNTATELYVRLINDHGTNYAYFDGVIAVEGEYVPAYTPRPIIMGMIPDAWTWCDPASTSLGPGLTRHILLNSAAAPQASEANAQVIVPRDGVVRHLLLYVESNTLNGSSTLTVRKNGADTALSVTIAAGATGILSNLLPVVSVSREDLITVKIATVGTTGSMVLKRVTLGYDMMQGGWSGYW